MLYNSLEFIFRFLPIFLLAYYVAPKKYRNVVLLCGSICFYSLGNVKYVPLLLISVGIDYGLGKLMVRAVSKKRPDIIWLMLGLVYHIGVLVIFKYSNFFLSSLSVILPKTVHLPVITAALPLGISFYTFTSVSYLVDVYRGKIAAENRLIDYGTYLCMFPQLLSGPIVRYDQISEQIQERTCSAGRLESGLKIFVTGLGYKVILADQLSTLWNWIQMVGFESISTPMAWLGVAAYSLELYFDFSGYSLMAIGIGEMLGFSLPVNFAHPYMARSVSEFWRRWHITLGEWFKNYVYIPLGGNRKGKLRQVFNLLIVWMLTGLWHGAGANFIVWGIYLFCFLVLEKFLIKSVLEHSVILSRVYLLFVIGLSWMIFAITDFHDLGIYFSRLFPFLPHSKGIAVNTADIWKQLKSYWLYLLAGILFSTPLPMRWYIKEKNSWACIILLLAVFWYCVYLITIGNDNPFLYFQF